MTPTTHSAPETNNVAPAVHPHHEPRTSPGGRPLVSLLTGDAVEVLRTLPAAAVDCVVTSPPFWRLRDYATGTWSGGNPTCTHPTNTESTPAVNSVTAPRQCTRCGASWTDKQYGLEPTSNAYIEHLRKVFAQL